ncbi:hypothetical protein ACOYW6_05355 [Parablastomonas sp. CN1-191]|uniref:hypothetical protein n=1 Tax=Parablastomonas sp. CN1-191 TaxID=3400908 RepID=UPI003BF78E34
MIEIEIQNETTQTQERLRFAVVPRIGEGIRLRDPAGFWASYDVLDLWYQKAEFGDVWVPYLHVRKTVGEVEQPEPGTAGGLSHGLPSALPNTIPSHLPQGAPSLATVHGEVVPFAT